MALTAAQLLADQAYLFGDFPTETLTAGILSLAVFVPRAEEASEWGMGGEHNLPRVTVIVNRNQAPGVPDPDDLQVGNTVTFRSASWRIMRIRHDHPNSPLSVDLESISGKPL